MRQLRLSASSNSEFLECQHRYRLSYIYGIEPEQEKESLRIGSMWHKCHELLELKPGEFCPRCAKREEVSTDCYICAGMGRVPEEQMDCVIRYLNTMYAKTPDNTTAEEWELERTKLLYSLTGHRWYYKGVEERFEVIGSEIKFEIPIYRPGGQRAIKKAVFVCKIDRLVRDKESGLVYVWERKSTGRPLNDQYWTDLTTGDQIMGYLYGGRMAQRMGLLAPYGIKSEDDPIAGAFCDVWHKPDISPKTLSQADTKKFVETGEYCGEKFEVETGMPWKDGNGNEIPCIKINGVPSTIIEGKQGYAIRETSEMYGARLLQDITERPANYFQQRPVTRTDLEVREFAERLPKLADQIRYVERYDLWLPCKGACNATYRCTFYDLCQSGRTYTPGEPAPVGYKLGWGSVPAVPDFRNGTEVQIGE